MAAHPDDHVGDHHDGGRTDHRLQPVLLCLRQAGRPHLQGNRGGETDRDRDRDARPHEAQRVGAAPLAEEGGHDADDERPLQAFAQADDERFEHDFPPCPPAQLRSPPE